MGQAFRYPNLLRGTRDLGGCHHPKEEISVAHDGGLGFAVARLAPTTTAGGLVFDDQDVPESERAGGAAFCLSFLARADVAGDRIHSEVWGSRYALDATLGTEWRLVTMPYGFVRATQAQVYLNGVAGNSGAVHLALPMANRGTTPAAWAPAEGEGLAGGGALMSANLLEGLKAHNTPVSSDGTWHHAARTATSGHDDWLAWDLAGQSALEANQTFHVGLSTRGASADSASLHATIGYRDAAGNVNWANSAPLPIGTSWGRAEATMVVPSGMTPLGLYVAAYGTCPETWMAAPTLSYGSPVTLASDAHTPYATQGHVAAGYATKAALKVTSDAVTAEVTERGRLAGRVGTLESTTGTHTSKLAQLAASITSLVKGESTYTDPDGRSATSGVYSLVQQTRDSVTALFGGYTKTADLASTAAVRDAKQAGTDAASAASAAQGTADAAKSAASKAQSTADGAKSTADGLATMVRQDSSGVTVGKSSDGETWSTGRTRMTADGLDVLDKAGKLLARFGAKVIELGRGSPDAAIDLLGGLARIKATSDSTNGGAWCKISTDELMTMNGYYESRLAAGYKDYPGFTPKGTAEVIAAGGEDDGGVMLWCAGPSIPAGNSFAMSPTAYTLNHPEYLAAALLGTGGDGLGGTTDGVATASDLNTCGPGVWSYGSSTANRPTDWGLCLSFSADRGNWLFQLALPTTGDPHWRRNVNGGGWTAWWQWATR
jgi:hypothetical protein